MSLPCTQHEMEQRLVRYADLRPCTTAFVDTRTPGNQKENFTIIGPGVAENPEQYVHIDIPHGFNIGGVRQEPHCVNSQHSHETAEVFIVQNSTWAFCWGVDGTDGEVILGPGDVISIPTQVFRGFENVGEEAGYMCSVLGGDDPGRVTWAPQVFELAKEHGLVLLENGQLMDTARGETVPEDVPLMPPTTETVINSMRGVTLEDMQGCVVTAADFPSQGGGYLSKIEGVEEIAIIGDANPNENMPAGKMTWPHGFHLRRVTMAPSSTINMHRRHEEEVIYLYRGNLDVLWPEGKLTLSRGDVLTVPKNLKRSYVNNGNDPVDAFFVHGGDHPAAPDWGSGA